LEENSVNDIVEVPQVLVDQPVQEQLVEEKSVPRRVYRSRLKAQKRRLRSMASTAFDAESNEALAINKPDDDLPLFREIPPIHAQTALAEAQPSVVIWKQPEDITSREHVLEGPGQEPLDHVHEFQAKTALADAQPVTIEETTQVDVPSRASVLAALGQEPVPEVPAVQVETSLAAAQPTKIEWETPEDDIPSEADVMEALPQQEIAEVPVEAQGPGTGATELRTASPEKLLEGPPPSDMPEFPVVKTNEPVVDVVVIEAKAVPKSPRRTRAKATSNPKKTSVVLAKIAAQEDLPPVPKPTLEEPAEISPAPSVVPAVSLAQKDVAAFPGTPPRKIEWETPDDDIPSEADVLEALGKDKDNDAPAVQPAAEPVQVFARVQPLPAPEAEPSLPVKQVTSVPVQSEKMTYVPRISKRLTIEIEPVEAPASLMTYSDTRPRRSRRSLASTFSFGARTGTVIDRTDPLFAAYGSSSRITIHSKKIAGSVVALAVLFFIGRFVVNHSIPAETAGDSAVASKKAPARGTLPQADKPFIVSPTAKTAVKITESSPQKEAEVLQVKALPPKEPPSLSTKERSPEPAADKTVKNQPSKTALVSRNYGPMPSPTSTLVISYGTGKVKSSIETDKGPLGKKQTSTPAKGGEVTRPRVVKNPKGK
jgi:hypothetical protein